MDVYITKPTFSLSHIFGSTVTSYIVAEPENVSENGEDSESTGATKDAYMLAGVTLPTAPNKI